MNRSIFLDRDGTIIEEKNYLSDVKQILLLENSVKGLKILQDNFLLIIVSNQSGVARGYFTEKEVNKVNEALLNMLEDQGVHISGVYYCPHYVNGVVEKYSINCNCRKPKTGLIDKACLDFSIDLNKSYVIGDKDSDIQLAKNAGCRSILIKNSNYLNKISPNYTAKDLYDAAKYILEKE